MQLCAVLACVCLCVAARAPPPRYDLRDAAALFHNFTHTHSKLYPSEEERAKRFEIFKQTLQRINERNSKRQFDHEAFYGITQFADLAASERLPTGLLRGAGRGAGCDVAALETGPERPERVDWRDREKVTSVKNQNLPVTGCESCWAFSTVGNIESQFAIKYNKSLDLSEQQLVDCDQENSACSGGLAVRAFQTIIKMGGIQSESDYPYVAKRQKCSFNESKVAVKLRGCIKYHISEEVKDLKAIINDIGPVSISLSVSSDTWRDYAGGIMSLEECPVMGPNHALVIVGYGVEGGVPYWTIKNSWGPDWGDRGYIRLSAGHNTCNLTYRPITSALL